MKTILKRRGSALITVVLLMAMMAVLTASLLNYTMTEKRGNTRNILQLRAKNMAENITVYAAEQLSTRFYRSKPTAAAPFTGTTALKMPDTTGTKNVLGTSNWAIPGNMELYAGVQAPTAMAAVTDSTDSNYGLYVQTVTVPIIAKGSVTHPVNGTLNSYVLQEMKVSLAPLFQFGMFYNMDMELYPSADFTVAGPVHTNGSLIAHPDGNQDIPITFTDRVTAAGGLYWQTTLKAIPRIGSGAQNPAVEDKGHVYFTHTNGTTTVDMKGTSTPVATMLNKWYDHKYGQSSETSATISAFKGQALSFWNGNVRTSAHGVTKLQLPGIGGYNETNLTSTGEDDRNNGRQLIDAPNPRKWQKTGSATAYSWESTTDDADSKESKIAWKAGLFIMVNPDSSPTPRSGTLPDGQVVYVLPRSYRAWINQINTATAAHTVSEVVLPGQPSYGYNNGADGLVGTSDDYMYHNLLPNRYDATTIAGDGTGNAVLRIPQQGFSSASGYKINKTSGYATGTGSSTVLTLKNGSGQILPGQFVTIGSFAYLVVAGSSGGAGNITIAGGPQANIADNDDVTVSNPTNSTGRSYKINHTGNYALGTTDLVIDNGSGRIYPGNTITISTQRYVVASASTGTSHTSLRLASPGIRGAVVADNVDITVESRETSLGTGINFITNSTSLTAPITSIPVDTGTGTILPGNIVAIGTRQYVVVEGVSGAGTLTLAAPGLIDNVADNIPVIVDSYGFSGYSVDIASPNGATSSGSSYPADGLSSPYSYFPADAYFFDMRRATSNRGVTSETGTIAQYDRSTVPYVPRACAKIDFDMARFKMMVKRTVNTALNVSMYDVRSPTVAGVTFTNSIYRAAGGSPATAPATFNIGMGASFNVFPDNTDNITKMRQDPYRVYYAPVDPADAAAIAKITGVSGVPDPSYYAVPASDFYAAGAGLHAWYDGIAVYINSVDAEVKAQASGVPSRIDSGVRLFNGRGNAVSITAKPGFTLVTNDAVYIVGHFNADGVINSDRTSSTASGGYSARYPDDTSEDLCAIMGDAVTILAHPTWGDATNGQANGWNDALSALPAGGSSAGWKNTDPLVGGQDGVDITDAFGPKVALLPNRSYPGNVGTSTANTSKLTGIQTEVSAALLCGIVPSNHNPTNLTDGPVQSSYSSWGTAPYSKAGNGVQSGGANNFPRLLEVWGDLTPAVPPSTPAVKNGLYIRGSIVALFESRVAMEPFTNSRCYGAPGRYWGLHQGLRDKDHHIPLEPILIGCNRNRYLELTPAQFQTKKAAIAALGTP